MNIILRILCKCACVYHLSKWISKPESQIKSLPCLKFKFLVGAMCGVCLKIGYYGFYGGFVIDY